jgi:hypothetical protein
LPAWPPVYRPTTCLRGVASSILTQARKPRRLQHRRKPPRNLQCVLRCPPMWMSHLQGSRFLSPIDKAIREDKPARPWSKNVPERSCTKDDECGDGFCDRGRCAAIWTHRERYGQRCESDRWCGGYLCIDGRCRSCASDEECTRTSSWQSDPKCDPVNDMPNARECSGVVSGFGIGTRGPIGPRKKSGQ